MKRSLGFPDRFCFGDGHDLFFFFKLFKNQQFPFAISKIFYTFAVQKVGLS